jgi:type IV pilus assembly protein PilQ
MMDVPWDQALDIVLKINGLDRERDGNIIRIAPAQRFIAERQERLQAQKAEVQIEPTVTQIVPVSYSKADDLKANLEKLLSERGSIFVDARTNTMIVTDTQRRIDDMLALVKTLDRQTPQVMIESRIVEASRNFLRDLGIQLGGGTTQTTNRNFPSTVTVNGGVATDNGNFLVDLPAAVGTGSGGAISFALAGASTLLNARLSALETTGHGKIVTNPKIATLDNTEAVIQSGRRIPYETVSNEGTQTEFADASISLRVTPHITADGFINMKIQAAKNEADFANTSANGVPTILTREASTEMLIKDGDTVVIGGLYQRTMQDDTNGVPGLSKIPVLGWLFQQNTSRDNNDELLIFITPRIIEQPEAPMQARAAMSY